MSDFNYRQKAEAQGYPLTEYILHRIKMLHEAGEPPRTLFAACPNSLTVIKAALRAAKRNHAPILFAATLNQVDLDKGYTGMTQKIFVDTVRIEAESIHFTGPVIIAVDHGGPWLKDLQTLEKWPEKKAMDAVKKSFEASVDAGYDLIHVDPTVDIFLPQGETIAIETVAERTVELIAHIEAYRQRTQAAPISYEVGTEEVHGGLADESVFDRFLMLLKDGLHKKNLNNVWPCFIVGKVGTDLHTTLFDTEVARNLTTKVASFNSAIKGHYTDDVSNPEAYPLSGMGAANVGPEFTVSEYNGLMEAEGLETTLFRKGRIARISEISKKLEEAVVNSGRWKKWLQPEEKHLAFDDLSQERKHWLTQTGCRYIWQNPEVLVAREILFDNLNRNGIDAETIVLTPIEHAMDKYFTAFNLVNLNNKL
ncbi:MAG: class II D-tagatose-bisphosphate aldolase, non-catalytic subunit [Bacteroidales bacterium]|nr:class II D-tagatose-bisphosphate aldolase, non-catalytic subunit [Bacteroidales bacterium]